MSRSPARKYSRVTELPLLDSDNPIGRKPAIGTEAHI